MADLATSRLVFSGALLLAMAERSHRPTRRTQDRWSLRSGIHLGYRETRSQTPIIRGGRLWAGMVGPSDIGMGVVTGPPHHHRPTHPTPKRVVDGGRVPCRKNSRRNRPGAVSVFECAPPSGCPVGLTATIHWRCWAPSTGAARVRFVLFSRNGRLGVSRGAQCDTPNLRRVNPKILAECDHNADHSH